MIPKPKDSGKRQEFDTGSRRDTREGKGRFDLLPARALKVVAMHFQNGSEKYGDRNWEMGQPLSRYLDSALRHIFAHLEGKRDEPHAVAAAWNLLCLIDTELRVREGLLPEHLADLPGEPIPKPGLEDGPRCHVCGSWALPSVGTGYVCPKCLNTVQAPTPLPANSAPAAL